MDSISSHVASSHVACSHVLVFPFMSKGHIIPLLDFAKILLRRSISVTVVTTSAKRPFIAESLNGTAASVVLLPFPTGTKIPVGIESTDKLPSMSLFQEFVNATSSMQPQFEQLLQTLPRVSFMVTDFFLWWTLHSANKFGIPRFAFSGMSCYSVSLSIEATRSGILGGSQPDHELVVVTRFPWIRLCKEDFAPHLSNPDEADRVFNMNFIPSILNSYGILVNSFYELEPTFVDYINTESSPKSWCVGPLCLTQWRPKVYSHAELKPTWVTWLDQKLQEKCRVLFVAFGSQAEISREQLEEIAIGLEESNVCFLLVLRKDESEWNLPSGFEERMRVRGRGIVIREWADQREILMHESVQGFLSHCGWNSVLESICAGVPIVAWPFLAEQFLNARMVEEELKIGLRVERCNGSLKGFVKWEGLKKTVIEVMEGDKGKNSREKVMKLAEMAKKATQEGGSSWSTINSLLDETCGSQKKIETTSKS